MSRRISSRDDLFLSALDMYTLLSLAFIGFAFFVSPLRGQESVDLPVARPDPTGEQGLSVRWVRGPALGAASAVAQGDCLIEVSGHPTAPDRQLRSSCAPSAFGADSGVAAELSELRDALGAGTPPAVVVRCSRKQGLAACASLQWLMHEAGFYPLIAVESSQR